MGGTKKKGNLTRAALTECGARRSHRISSKNNFRTLAKKVWIENHYFANYYFRY